MNTMFDWIRVAMLTVYFGLAAFAMARLPLPPNPLKKVQFGELSPKVRRARGHARSA